MSTRVDTDRLAADIARRYRIRKVLAWVLGSLFAVAILGLHVLGMFLRLAHYY